MKLKPAQKLLFLLARWDRRRRLQSTLVWVPRGIMSGLGAGLVMAIIARMRPWLMTGQLVIASLVAVAAGIIATLAVVWLRQHDALMLARRFDSLFGLKERVSTSLELASGHLRAPNEEINTRLLDDALKRAESINVRAYIPLRLIRREMVLLVAMLLALVLLLVLENPQMTALAEQQTIQNTIQEQITSLENLRDEITSAADLSEETRQELVETLDRAIEQLSQQELSQEEAVATLSDLTEQLQSIADSPPAADAARQQAYQRAAQQLSEDASNLSDAFQQADPQQMSDAFSQLGESLDNMTQAERQELADALNAAAQQLAQNNPELAQSLQNAAEALQNGNTQGAQQALNAASQQMSQQASQTPPTSPQNRSRQIASQAAQQAQQGAQQVAQAGNQNQQQSSQSAGAQPQPGEGATRIQQSSQDGEGQLGEDGQPANSNQAGQAGEGTEPGAAQAGENRSETVGAAGGAGDSSGGGSDEGVQGSGEQISQNNSPSRDSMTDYEPVFAPQSIGDQSGQQMDLTGSNEPGDIVTQEGDLAENQAGESIVGYDRVFTSYVNAANEALERDYIPLSLRDVVHDYFTSLEP